MSNEAQFVIRKSSFSEGLKDLAHPLDPKAKRKSFSLGDKTKLGKVGIHYVVIAPGDTSTVLHSHKLADEFLFIVSGQGTLRLDDEEILLEAGDFVGLPATGPAHLLRNEGKEPLCYLMGGDRPRADVCVYPALQKRAYLYFEGDTRRLDFVEDSGIKSK